MKSGVVAAITFNLLYRVPKLDHFTESHSHGRAGPIGASRSNLRCFLQQGCLDVTLVEGTDVGVTTKNKKRGRQRAQRHERKQISLPIYSTPSAFHFSNLPHPTMSSTIYRRQSMAQLYEKLRAQDDDDDMAWLAQFSPDDKFDEPYVPAVRPPPVLSTISSASPVSSCSPSSSLSDSVFDDESSDDPFDFDSDSDVDPEPPLELPYTEFDESTSPSLILFVFSSDSLCSTRLTD